MGDRAGKSTGNDRDPTFDPDAETVTEAWEGVFIATSWGYGQTTVNLAQITDVSDTGKTVLCRLVTAERVGHDRANEYLRPNAEQYGDEFRLHVRTSHGDSGQPVFRGSYPYINGHMDDGTRRDDVLITLAPAVVLTVVGLLLLVVVDSPLGAAMVLVALIANAAGTGSDLATVLALRRLPAGTLFYYGEGGKLAYEPDTTAA